MTPNTAPSTDAAFQERLQDLAGQLPKRLLQCARFLAAHPDRIAISTVAELAAGAGVQPSSMMRFCQIMGFSGFSDMQQLFRTSYAPNRPDYATRLEQLRKTGQGGPVALLAEFVDAGRNSLESLARTIDGSDLDRAVARLAQAGTIHVIGLRRAYPAASYLSYAFEKMKIPSMLHDGAGRLDHRHAIRPGDVLIAIAFAPYSPETVELASYCLARDVAVVAITDAIGSPLRQADVVALSVNEIDFGEFRTLAATMSLVVALAVAVGAAGATTAKIK